MPAIEGGALVGYRIPVCKTRSRHPCSLLTRSRRVTVLQTGIRYPTLMLMAVIGDEDR